jgi:ABC-type transporter Mla subunit MlaD
MCMVLLGSAPVGLLAVQKLRAMQQRSQIRIVFDGSANGLRRGGPVNFDGIQAGEILSIKLESLHNVDRVIVDNADTVKDALLSFETYTASLKSKGEALDAMIDKADNAFAGFDDVVSKIEGAIPGFADGKPDELLQKVQSLRELADTFRQKSATFTEEGRRTLLDVSQTAQRMDHKFEPQAAGTAPAAPPRKPQQKRP